jgi:FlaA1/EpsC-like NDP-sugar epimerase
MQDQPNPWESIFRLTPTPLDLSRSAKVIKGKTILITGAGSSIGSTLALELGKHRPRHIILLDAYEQSLHRLNERMSQSSAERTSQGSSVPHTALLGSVTDPAMLDHAIERYRPQVIFHTAALKHVPLMELNPFAALQTNAIGTFNLAQTAAKHSVKHMVMVSTDKAVEPASIMGASKRIAELIALAMQWKAVRLSNVLASEGSIVPLFQRQIDRGEPLGVTHPEASRYFLTMQHAAQLLLLALSGEFAPGILVPELGEPVRIEDIARRMLANLKDPHPSQLVYTGLRPGDKLIEKQLSDRESFAGSREAPLRPIHSEGPPLSRLSHAMQELEQAVRESDLYELLRIVGQLVPGYRPSEVIQNAMHQQATMKVNR